MLEERWALQPGDLDMIVMWHRFHYRDAEGRDRVRTSHLVHIGEDETHTAMSLTVGLAVGACRPDVVRGDWSGTGVLLPTTPDLYAPLAQGVGRGRHCLHGNRIVPLTCEGWWMVPVLLALGLAGGTGAILPQGTGPCDAPPYDPLVEVASADMALSMDRWALRALRRDLRGRTCEDVQEVVDILIVRWLQAHPEIHIELNGTETEWLMRHRRGFPASHQG